MSKKYTPYEAALEVLKKAQEICKKHKKDYFTNSQFSDGKHFWNVEDVYDFAKKNSKVEEISVSKLESNRKYWQGNKKRMMDVDTSYPILVVIEPDGFWSVSDGLNRLEKVITVEKKDTIPAYVVNKKDIIDLAVKKQ